LLVPEEDNYGDRKPRQEERKSKEERKSGAVYSEMTEEDINRANNVSEESVKSNQGKIKTGVVLRKQI
jgi:hypothetical protein